MSSTRSLLSASPSLRLLPHPLAMAADTYPSKPIRWVVAYSAGGGSDALARWPRPASRSDAGGPITTRHDHARGSMAKAEYERKRAEAASGVAVVSV
jgi:tripartite-type tricarboxylate transporter receptor subunit TctC